MGVRGEVFSTKVTLQNRTYFFNVKENRLGDLYLNIVESKNRDEGGFERQSVILFADDIQEFLQGFDESLKVLEKEVRDKRRGKRSEGEKPRDYPKEYPKDYTPRDHKSDSSDGVRPRRSSPRSRDDAPPGERSYRGHGHRDTARRDDGPGRGTSRPGGRRDSGPRSSDFRPRDSRPKNSRSTDNRSSDRRSDGYRPSEKLDYAPRKKKVVVRKH